jgi:hypothetical protein
MTTSNGPLRTGTAKVEQIPVRWALSEHVTGERRLVIWLAPGLDRASALQQVLGEVEGRAHGHTIASTKVLTGWSSTRCSCRAGACATGPCAPPASCGARSSILVVHVGHVLVPA